MAGDCHTIAAEPRKLPSLVDLSDELDRIERLSGAMHLGCLGNDDPGLIELSVVLQDSIQAFNERFEAFRKSGAGA